MRVQWPRLFDLFKAFVYIDTSGKFEIMYRIRSLILHECATFSELPSYKSNMALTYSYTYTLSSSLLFLATLTFKVNPWSTKSGFFPFWKKFIGVKKVEIKMKICQICVNQIFKGNFNTNTQEKKYYYALWSANFDIS